MVGKSVGSGAGLGLNPETATHQLCARGMSLCLSLLWSPHHRTHLIGWS